MRDLRSERPIDETSAEVGRWVLSTYALLLPPLALLIALMAGPGSALSASAGFAALGLAGAGWVLWRRSSRHPCWAVPGAIVPALCAAVAYFATRGTLLTVVLLTALIAWAAVLFEPAVWATAWGGATLVACTALREDLRTAKGAAQAAAFGAVEAGVAWLLYRRAHRGREPRSPEVGKENSIELAVAQGRALMAANDGAVEAHGYSRDELLGLDIRALRAASGVASAGDELKAAAAGGIVFQTEDIRRDGTAFPVEVSTRPFLREGRRLLHRRIRDLSAPWAKDDALEHRSGPAPLDVRSEQEKRERILAVVAHDLRSPLSAIALSAHALERLAGEPNAREALAERRQIIVSAAERMERLVEDLLDEEAIQRGQLRLALAPASPAGLCREALAQAQPAADARDVSLSLEAAPATPATPATPAIVRCDRGRILQVLGNLISNALHASPRGGAVSLIVVGTPGAVEFQVRDSGPGIPADIVPRLFEPYQRGADARYKGAGLGLAISRGIVEGHGGRIWAELARDGGADLRFTLPQEAPDPLTPCAPSPS